MFDPDVPSRAPDGVVGEFGREAPPALPGGLEIPFPEEGAQFL